MKCHETFWPGGKISSMESLQAAVALTLDVVHLKTQQVFCMCKRDSEVAGWIATVLWGLYYQVKPLLDNIVNFARRRPFPLPFDPFLCNHRPSWAPKGRHKINSTHSLVRL